jgi:aerobic-type carbon monoxide dehydrogenase small subunit (CoxS/CutS family)
MAATYPPPVDLRFQVDGRDVSVADDGASLLEVLRDRLGIRSAKDGCSPQGQCGCCTVLVDGQARVACVTPARRVAGRAITTLDGLPADVRDAWAKALTDAGASQCGFCTPGIIVRLAALRGAPAAEPLEAAEVEQALLAHLCRCTGWRTIVEAAANVGPTAAARPRDLEAAGRRATIEGGVPQRVGPDVALGRAGFADDTAPSDSLVAVIDDDGGWVVGETLTEARRLAGRVQGRRTTLPPSHPLDVPEGEWDVTLRTTWVEPAYLEPDASWCAPGGQPASPLANGGAFGGKSHTLLPGIVKSRAEALGRPLRVVLSREDTVIMGAKRPPIAAGVRADGTGVIRVVRTPGIAEAIAAVTPQLVVEEVDHAGPGTGSWLRAAGWAEAAIVVAAATGSDTITSPWGSWARAKLADDGSIDIEVSCGDPLDAVVLRSYCVGAAHMGLSWVRSEALAVDAEGRIHDLTIRSFGILRARDMPDVRVTFTDEGGEPVNGSDAVFAAVALAAWKADGLPPEWPTRRGVQ